MQGTEAWVAFEYVQQMVKSETVARYRAAHGGACPWDVIAFVSLFVLSSFFFQGKMGMCEKKKRKQKREQKTNKNKKPIEVDIITYSPWERKKEKKQSPHLFIPSYVQHPYNFYPPDFDRMMQNFTNILAAGGCPVRYVCDNLSERCIHFK